MKLPYTFIQYIIFGLRNIVQFLKVNTGLSNRHFCLEMEMLWCIKLRTFPSEQNLVL